MVLPDVNVLVYAHREDAVSGFLRVVTHPRVFRDPTPLGLAQEFAVSIREHPNAVTLTPGERHWDIFQRLCQEVNAKGNLIADADE